MNIFAGKLVNYVQRFVSKYTILESDDLNVSLLTCFCASWFYLLFHFRWHNEEFEIFIYAVYLCIIFSNSSVWKEFVYGLTRGELSEWYPSIHSFFCKIFETFAAFSTILDLSRAAKFLSRCCSLYFSTGWKQWHIKSVAFGTNQ